MLGEASANFDGPCLVDSSNCQHDSQHGPSLILEPRPRGRSGYLQQAIDITKQEQCWPIHQHLWDSVKLLSNLACLYAQSTSDKKLVLVNTETDEIKILDYITRFSPNYPKRNYAKFMRYEEVLSRWNNFLFLTFTLNPRYFSTLKGSYIALQKAWNRILTMLRRKFPNICFIKVVEFHKSGMPHLHILLGGRRWISKNWLLKFWPIGHQVHITRVNGDIHQVMFYMGKYLFKNDTLDRILHWSLMARSFSVSRNLSCSLDNSKTNSISNYCRGPGYWVYYGSFDSYLIPLEAGIYNFYDIYDIFYRIAFSPG